MCFSAQFWNERYQSQQTGWDLKSPSTPLKEYIDQLSDLSLRILIPGCGNAYEAEYLLEKGFSHITLIDISEVLVQTLQEKFKNYPQIQVILGDFFDLQGSYDLILEQTFFCALNPNLRKSYVHQMYHLLSINGKLIGLLFNHNFNNLNPPYGGNKDEYENYFKHYFNIERMEKCYNSIQPRKDKELFIHLIKK